ncbi:hypothetical protein DB30_00994 [Enhygromyxa salina]|uniref:Uncharacterized protein n=1 Tax=Enhygromyxa salina TaxID=215803 RepID=A0A0C2CNN4_9BACT|nr:hypothetical protein DB30_00994 [Enhygromyxa salina]
MYAHIAWVNTSSVNVSYRVYPAIGGTDKLSRRLDQGTGTGCGCGGTVFDAGVCKNTPGELCDEWVVLGSFGATVVVTYTLQIGNNTVEADQNLKLALDDVLIIRR